MPHPALPVKTVRGEAVIITGMTYRTPGQDRVLPQRRRSCRPRIRPAHACGRAGAGRARAGNYAML